MGEGIITRADLAPLLVGTWRGTRAAFACLHAHLHVLERALRPVWRKGAHRLRCFSDEGDLLQHTLVALVEKAARKQGLALPAGWAHPDLTRWLVSVVGNQARSIVRAERRRDDHTRSIAPDELARRQHADLALTKGIDPSKVAVQRHDARALKDEVERSLQHDEHPPAPALAWVLLNRPELLQPAWVERACGQAHQGHRGTVRGLVREPAETVRLLDAWFDRHGADPGGATSRRELAWILRSGDDSSPEAWRAARPDEVSKALDALRKWENRFRARLEELCKGADR